MEKETFIEKERKAMANLSEKDRETALRVIASHPVRAYLVALVDDLVRQGIYMTPVEQEGAKLMVRIIGGELKKGQLLIDKRNKEQQERKKK